MTLMPAVLDLPVPSNLDIYEQAASFKTNLVWKQLEETSVEEALSYWLPTLSPKTQLSYRSGIKKLIEFGWLNPLMSLQQFSLVNHESIIDHIKLFLYKTIPLEDLEYITVDEFSIRKGHEYMTVFTDLRSGRIIHAVEGRTIEAVAPFFRKLAKHAPKLKAIAMDMSKSYSPAAQEFLPNVDVIFDHFHVTALLNKALDEVRKDQQQNLNGADAKVLKGSRFLPLAVYDLLQDWKEIFFKWSSTGLTPLYLLAGTRFKRTVRS